MGSIKELDKFTFDDIKEILERSSLYFIEKVENPYIIIEHGGNGQQFKITVEKIK